MEWSDPGAARDPVSPFSELAAGLALLGRSCYDRGWVLGTSGNFSAVAGRAPLRLAITATGLDKGALTAEQVVLIDADGQVVRGARAASAESSLHLAIVRARGAGAVAHTHSVWDVVLSELDFPAGGVALEGFEMLKGLAGVRTHLARAWVPILDNAQDYGALAPQVERVLAEHPQAHAFLLRGHGLYTWGRELAEVKRHLEVLEYLFEVVGRVRAGGAAR